MSRLPVGLLMNFHERRLVDGVSRYAVQAAALLCVLCGPLLFFSVLKPCDANTPPGHSGGEVHGAFAALCAFTVS
jgi:hypothetical protein